MILTCPSCGTQYVVKDGAIPPEGRQVRCAACKHSWHQQPEGAEAGAMAASASDAAVAEEAPAPPAAEEAPGQADAAAPRDGGEDESFAEAALIEPRSGPEAEERAYEEAMVAAADEPAADAPAAGLAEAPVAAPAEDRPAAEADWREPPEAEPEGDTFEAYYSPDEEAPRRKGRLLPVLLLILAVAALAAALWFLAPPEWKAQLGIGGAGASPLALVTTHMDRQRLESGNELLTVTGRVINPTSREQDVPPLQAQLKTRDGKVVHSWTIAPPARSLPPGASASFNSAEVNVPPGGEELTITVGPPAP
jgi:predicted Zn finger-like uncharacterized protein